jgi:hypothetical protein
MEIEILLFVFFNYRKEERKKLNLGKNLVEKFFYKKAGNVHLKI